MGIVETEAIILRTYNLAEADKIVLCLTRKAGVIRAVARGARRLKSRFGAGLEPLTLVAISYHEKEGRELATLRQAEILSSYFKLGGDAELIYGLARMAELALEFSPPHEPNEKLYRMMSACLYAVSKSPQAIGLIGLYFEFWLLKLSGFLPDVIRCAECGKGLGESPKISLNAECRLRCGLCGKGAGTEMSAEAYKILVEMRRESPEAFSVRGAGVSAGARKELERFTDILIRRALERDLRTRAL